MNGADYWEAFSQVLPASALWEAWRASPGFPSDVAFGTDLDWYAGNKERYGRLSDKTIARVQSAVRDGKADEVAATVRWPERGVGVYPTTWWGTRAVMWINPENRPSTIGVSVLTPETEQGNLTHALRDAAWETARRWVALLEPALLHGFCVGWDGISALYSLDPYIRGGVGPGLGEVGGYSWITLLAPPVVERLGGVDRVVTEAPVALVERVVYSSGDNAVLCRVGDSPASVPIERWRQWKDFLTPVLCPKGPGEVPDTHRKPWLLEEDW